MCQHCAASACIAVCGLHAWGIHALRFPTLQAKTHARTYDMHNPKAPTHQDVWLNLLDDRLRDVVLVIRQQAVQEFAGVTQQLLGRLPVVRDLCKTIDGYVN